MSCAGDPAILPDEIVAPARRAVGAGGRRLPTGEPLYIIGTEVPVPGGASQGHALQVTTPDAAYRTLAIHKQAFACLEVSEKAWSG